MATSLQKQHTSSEIPWYKKTDIVIGLSVGILGAVVTVVFALWQNTMLAVVTITITVIAGTLTLCVLRARDSERRAAESHQQLAEIKEEYARNVVALERQYSKVADSIHHFIHAARDHASQWTKDYEDLLRQEERREISLEEWSKETRKLINQFVGALLEEMRSVFQPLVPSGTPLWSAIREARPGKDGHTYYHTLLRAGPCNHDRAGTSEAIPEDQGVPVLIRQRHASGNGIVIIHGHPTDLWRMTKNDHRHEDESVMAGPIFIKDGSHCEMHMILYLNSPAGQVFDERLIPYMSCCTDMFSLFFNMIGPIVEDIRKHAAQYAKEI